MVVKNVATPTPAAQASAVSADGDKRRSSGARKRSGSVLTASSDANSTMIDCSSIRAVRLSGASEAKGSSDLRQELQLLRVGQDATERIGLAEAHIYRGAVNVEERRLVEHVAPVPPEVEPELDAGGGHFLNEQERVRRICRLSLRKRLGRQLGNPLHEGIGVAKYRPRDAAWMHLAQSFSALLRHQRLDERPSEDLVELGREFREALNPREVALVGAAVVVGENAGEGALEDSGVSAGARRGRAGRVGATIAAR